jgi:hypothetical protein
MKLLIIISLLCRIGFNLGMGAVAICLLVKTHWENNTHVTLRQDPMEQWIALGVAYICIKFTFNKGWKE